MDHNGKRPPITFAILLSLICCVTPAWADTAAPEVAFLDQLATQGIPPAYGQILEALTDGANDAFVEGVKNKSVDMAKLANQSVWRDKISKVNQAVGRLYAVMDIGGKIYSEQYDDAMVTGAMTILSELAATESGKALLGAYGITPPMVTAVVVAVQITWESHKAFTKATMGRQLESLYGSVESLTRNSASRQLGQGDPFPVTSENIEKVWRRIVNNPDFRELFRVYVTLELQKTFPEPDFFDKIDIYLAEPVISVLSGSQRPKAGYAAAHLDPSLADTPATTADRYEDVQKLRLKQQYEEIKPYIAGLVGYLNRAAKLREQQTLARRELLALQTKLKGGGSIEDAIAKIQKALTMSGVVEKYLERCMADIDKAAKEEDYKTLQVHMNLSTDYVRDVVAWLPATGPTADLHKQLLAGLKKSYAAARAAFEKFRLDLQERIEKPKPAEKNEPDTGTTAEPEIEINPQEYYKSDFKPLLKPFDWGGLGDPSYIITQYENYLDQGLFAYPSTNTTAAGNRQPLADIVAKAWKIENFAVADKPSAASDGNIPSPDPEMTIDGHFATVVAKVDEKGKTYPDGIITQQRQLNEQSEANQKLWNEGNDLYWGRNPKPPAGETKEQAAARRAAGQAKMDAATQAGNNLKPAWQQLAALKEAWTQAYEMAKSVAAAQAVETRLAYDTQSLVMANTRVKYHHRAHEANNHRIDLVGQLNALALPPLGVTEPVAAEPELTKAQDYLKENAYTHLPAFFKAGEEGSSTELNDLLFTRASRLTEQARQMRAYIGYITGRAQRKADGYEAAAETLDGIRKTSLPELDEIRRFIDPAFLDGDGYDQRRKQVPGLVKQMRAEIRSIDDTADQNAGNMETDAAWLRQTSAAFTRFIDLGTGLGILAQSGSYGGNSGFKAPEPQGSPFLMKYPYAHLLVEQERAQLVTQMRAVWQDGPLAAFADKMAPWLGRMAEAYFEQLGRLPAVKEENFILVNKNAYHVSNPVTASALTRAENTMNAAPPGSGQFMKALGSLNSIMAMGISYPKENGYEPSFDAVDVPQGLELARRYVAFRDKLKQSYDQHVQLWDAHEKQQQQADADNARRELPGLIATLNQRISASDRLIARSRAIADRDRQALQEAVAALKALRNNDLLAEPYPQVVSYRDQLLRQAPDDAKAKSASAVINDLNRLATDLAVAVSDIQARLRQPVGNAEAKAFYEQFKTAYESRDASQVMHLIDDDWSAGDGTTLYDLEVSFSQIFDLFDDIRFELTGLTVEPVSGQRFRCTYKVAITGRSYRNNLKHVEKSTVSEELVLDGAKSKIMKTLQGNYWYIE